MPGKTIDEEVTQQRTEEGALGKWQDKPATRKLNVGPLAEASPPKLKVVRGGASLAPSTAKI